MDARTDFTPTRAPTGRPERLATRLTFLATGFAMAAWAPLVPFAKMRLGLDEGALGLLLLALGLGSIVAMPVTGILTTRYGCRAILAVGMTVFALTVPVLAVAPSFATMAIALAVFGASIGTVDVAMNIQAVIVEKDAGRPMMSGFHGHFSLGAMIGAGGVSLMLMLGLTPLAAAVAVGLLVLVVLAFVFKHLLPFSTHDGGGAPAFVLPRGFVIFVGMLSFLLFLAEGAILDWSAVFLVAERGLDPAAGGYGYALFSVTMTIGRLLGDRIVALLGGVKVMTIGGFLTAAGFALLLVPSQATALAAFLLIGIGAANVVPVLFTAAAAQKEMPASLAIAAVTTLGYAGILVGPALIGFVAHFANLNTAFAILALAMAFVGLSGRVARR